MINHIGCGDAGKFVISMEGTIEHNHHSIGHKIPNLS